MDSDSLLATLALVLSLLAFGLACLLAAMGDRLRREANGEVVPQGRMSARALERLLSHPQEMATARLGVRALPATAVLFSLLALLQSLQVLHWALAGVLLMAAALLLLALDKGLQVVARWGILRLVPLAVVALWGISWLLRPLANLGVLPWPGATSEGGGTLMEFLQEDSQGRQSFFPLEGHHELDPHEARMIRAILRLEKIIAREIMVPRVDMVVAEVNTPLQQVVRLMLQGGHSRIPVYEGHVDRILGVLHSRDLLRYLDQPQELPHLQSLVRPALFIPEVKTLDELLREFQEKRVHMAIVVDEYGGTAGLVTIEDLLEEIVGEIQDEFDTGEREVQHIREGEAVVDARVTLDHLRELFRVEIQGEGFDTLGGLVYTHLGRIPNPGDVVESSGLKIQVLSTRGRRIKKLHVVKTNSAGTRPPKSGV